ncbi:hypothetical protein SAMN05518849_101131 [Sphingobium sp. AP50]|uniref:hypothetical protein n=1 Tax=Sphingobium sp. AP50 TaxID=1884369 RepID=UPI0008D3733C|nr:hypothetical protein [Sphingobium sp. AP50]SEI57389.1 hypothetical protein SAMN05518849_101131 [Sphingobium sp. AP50]
MKQLISLLALTAMITGCSDRPRTESLVGDWPVASDATLAGESITLQFRKYGDGDLSRTLSYTLAPDGQMTVERGADHHVCCFGGVDGHFIDSRKVYSLPQGRAMQLRRMFGRLRPEKLTADLPFVLPKGCTYIFDGGAVAGVNFDKGSAGGSFIFQSGCDGDGARQVQHMLRAMQTLLPPVENSLAYLPPAT